MKFNFYKILSFIIIAFFASSKIQSQDYHWQFNNDEVVSTNGYPVILEDTNPDMFVPGKIDKAISFDGADQFPYSKNVSLGNSGSYSISFWINPSSSPNSGKEYFIASKREGANQFQVFINDFDQLEFYLYEGNTPTSTRIVSNENIPCNRWSHIAITISNENSNRFITMYINGVQVNKQPFYFTPNTVSSTIVFGNKFANGTDKDISAFKGSLDSFRINGGRVISYDEIQSLANQNPEPDHRWKFDEYQTKVENDAYVSIVKDFYGYKDGRMNRVIPKVEGKIGYSAIKFGENTLNYISVNNVETSNTKSYSLSFWIKPIQKYPSNTYTILKKRETKNQYQVALLPTGQIRFHLWGNSYASITSNIIPTDSWTNIILTVDNLNKKITLYKNGTPNEEKRFDFEPWYGVDQLIIGDNSNDATSDILLDDVRIYNNKVLDSDLISEIYNYNELPSPVTAPIKHEKYYRTEYLLYDYDPNFIPGPVTFDLDNIPYIRKDDYVQTIENGKWVRFSFYDVIKNELEKLNTIDRWSGNFDRSEGYDTRIIFDDNGWAYTFISTNIINHNLVLYSTDKCRTWKALNKHIRWKNALWETRQPHGDLELPPILLTSEVKEDPEVKDLDVHFFRKNLTANNTLNFEKQLTIDNVSVGVSHSGGPSQVVTKNNESFLIYSKMHEEGQTILGNPTYFVKINRNNLPATINIGTSIKVGYAGENEKPDSHNYGSIVIDGNGYLHVVLSGHKDQYLKYTKSTESIFSGINSFEDITEFGGHFVGESVNGHTYNSLICDENNTLHCITRWSGHRNQYRIAYLSKIQNKNWIMDAEHESLVIPFEADYNNWYHKVSVDRNNNLYLNYQLSHQKLTKEAFNIYLKEYPEEGFLGSYIEGKQYTNMKPKFPSMLKLESTKNNWKLVTTQDFLDLALSAKESKKDDINKEIKNYHFILFPNPSKGYINLKLLEPPNKQSIVNVYDLMGRKIKSIQLENQDSNINISDLTKGIYLFEVTGNNRGIKKIIIE